MEIATILPKELVFLEWETTCKKQMIQDIALKASHFLGVHERDIFQGLLDRERLGCTSMGHGVAVPHARVKGLTTVTAVFFRLKRAIPFEAADGEPVDLVMALLAPAEEQHTDHLRALSAITRLMRDRLVCESARQATSKENLYRSLTEPQGVE